MFEHFSQVVAASTLDGAIPIDNKVIAIETNFKVLKISSLQ